MSWHEEYDFERGVQVYRQYCNRCRAEILEYWLGHRGWCVSCYDFLHKGGDEFSEHRITATTVLGFEV